MSKTIRSFHVGSSSSSLAGGSGKIFGVPSKYLLWSLIALIVIAAGYFIYTTMSSKFSTKYKEGNTNQGENNEAELMLFYVDWCPHCKTAKPEWEQVKSEYDGKVVNGSKILFTEINCTDETPEVEKMISQYKIEGYPTIKLVKNGQVIDFDAKPTKSTLTQFINTAA